MNYWLDFYLINNNGKFNIVPTFSKTVWASATFSPRSSSTTNHWPTYIGCSICVQRGKAKQLTLFGFMMSAQTISLGVSKMCVSWFRGWWEGCWSCRTCRMSARTSWLVHGTAWFLGCSELLNYASKTKYVHWFYLKKQKRLRQTPTCRWFDVSTMKRHQL